MGCGVYRPGGLGASSSGPCQSDLGVWGLGVQGFGEISGLGAFTLCARP